METKQKPKDVCPRECPERAWDCHGKCDKYTKFRQEKLEEYEKRVTDTNVTRYVAESIIRCSHKAPVILKKNRK